MISEKSAGREWKEKSIIFLRNNLLTYYADKVKIPALKMVLKSLAPEGFLIIGSHERISLETTVLKTWGDNSCIFQKP